MTEEGLCSYRLLNRASNLWLPYPSYRVRLPLPIARVSSAKAFIIQPCSLAFALLPQSASRQTTNQGGQINNKNNDHDKIDKSLLRAARELLYLTL